MFCFLDWAQSYLSLYSYGLVSFMASLVSGPYLLDHHLMSGMLFFKKKVIFRFLCKANHVRNSWTYGHKSEKDVWIDFQLFLDILLRLCIICILTAWITWVIKIKVGLHYSAELKSKFHLLMSVTYLVGHGTKKPKVRFLSSFCV